MTVNFKVGVRWTSLIVVSLAMCMIFSLAGVAQNNADKVLDENAVTALLNQLADGLGDLIEDDAQITAVVDKWNAREGLEGKTRAQILPLLFADVQSVIKDPAIRTKIWKAWNPPAPVSTIPKPAATPGPKPAATPGPAPNPQGLDEIAAFDLADDLKRRFAGLISGRRIPNANIRWTDLNTLTGKTRAEIMRLLFADVQSVITDPASRTLIWNEWNRPAAPPAQLRAPQPLPQTPIGYLAIVTQGGKDDQFMTENIPLLKWDVTIIDGQKKPIAGARVSMRLTFGMTGDNVFRSINGKSVAEGIMHVGRTDSTGTCSFSIPWTRNARYELTVANSQGAAFKYIDGIAYDGAPIIEDFTWGVRWEASRTLVVETAEGYAKSHAAELGKKQADQTAITQILLRPDDNWSRTGWTPEWAKKAIEINATFNAPVSDDLRAKFTNSQKTLGAINLLKLALTPPSFDQLKKLYTSVQMHSRSNDIAVVTAEIGGKSVDLSVPFKQVPDAKLFQACKQKAAAKEDMTPDCGRALASVVPYQNRWNAINLSCLRDPALVPVANEFGSLVKAEGTFDAGLIKDDYPLFPDTEFSKNDYGPPDTRGWICSALVKNEMSKDMARDGFPPAVVNQVIGEQLEEEYPTITSTTIGGKLEKASDISALMNLFRQSKRVDASVNQLTGNLKRLTNEPQEAFRTRVESMLKNTVDPASGRRLDDSLFIFRLRSLVGRDPAKELETADLYLDLGFVHLYDSYDKRFDLTAENVQVYKSYMVFKGKVRPGQPIPDRRDLALAAFGWAIGVKEPDKFSGEHLGLVVKRWVLFNINTGEIYGTSEANGDGNNYGQLFRLDQ